MQMKQKKSFMPLENNRQNFSPSLSSVKSRKVGFLEGFTLVELLIVISIIAVLAATIFVAIDPVKRFAEARNARRWSEAGSILNAVLTYAVDHDGSLPTGIPTGTAKMLGTAANGCDSCTATTTDSACLDLSGDLVDTYLAEIPKDPKTGTDAKTGYYIIESPNGRIEVGACEPELGEVIRLKR